MVVEAKRSGEVRLRVTSKIMCGCMAMHGGIEAHDEEELYKVKPGGGTKKKQKR